MRTTVLRCILFLLTAALSTGSCFAAIYETFDEYIEDHTSQMPVRAAVFGPRSLVWDHLWVTSIDGDTDRVHIAKGQPYDYAIFYSDSSSPNGLGSYVADLDAWKDPMSVDDLIVSSWSFGGDLVIPSISTYAHVDSYAFATAGPATVAWQIKDWARGGDLSANDGPSNISGDWDAEGALYLFVEDDPGVPEILEFSQNGTDGFYARWNPLDTPTCHIERYYYYVYDVTQGGTLIASGDTDNMTHEVSILCDLVDAHTYSIDIMGANKAFAFGVAGTAVVTVALDTTPPGIPVVIDEGDISTSNTLTFSWNAVDDDLSGVAYYNCQIGTVPGQGDISNVGNVMGTTFVGSEGSTYYCRVQAVDNAGNISAWSSATDGITISASDTIKHALQAADDTQVTIRGAIVSATASDLPDSTDYQWPHLYLQQVVDGKTYGLQARVIADLNQLPLSLLRGKTVDILPQPGSSSKITKGEIYHADFGERVLLIAGKELSVSDSPAKPTLPATPLLASAVGGEDLNSHTLGVNTPAPPSGTEYNVGTLVKLSGTVTSVDVGAYCFYLDDGSLQEPDHVDGAPGIMVSWKWTDGAVTVPAVGSRVEVTGIAGCAEYYDSDGSPDTIIRVVRLRGDSDLAIYERVYVKTARDLAYNLVPGEEKRVSLTGCVATSSTGEFSNGVYIENMIATSGIRVVGWTGQVQKNSVCEVWGMLGMDNGEPVVIIRPNSADRFVVTQSQQSHVRYKFPRSAADLQTYGGLPVQFYGKYSAGSIIDSSGNVYSIIDYGQSCGFLSGDLEGATIAIRGIVGTRSDGTVALRVQSQSSDNGGCPQLDQQVVEGDLGLKLDLTLALGTPRADSYPNFTSGTVLVYETDKISWGLAPDPGFENHGVSYAHFSRYWGGAVSATLTGEFGELHDPVTIQLSDYRCLGAHVIDSLYASEQWYELDTTLVDMPGDPPYSVNLPSGNWKLTRRVDIEGEHPDIPWYPWFGDDIPWVEAAQYACLNLNVKNLRCDQKGSDPVISKKCPRVFYYSGQGEIDILAATGSTISLEDGCSDPRNNKTRVEVKVESVDRASGIQSAVKTGVNANSTLNSFMWTGVDKAGYYCYTIEATHDEPMWDSANTADGMYRHPPDEIKASDPDSDTSKNLEITEVTAGLISISADGGTATAKVRYRLHDIANIPAEHVMVAVYNSYGRLVGLLHPNKNSSTPASNQLEERVPSSVADGSIQEATVSFPYECEEKYVVVVAAQEGKRPTNWPLKLMDKHHRQRRALEKGCVLGVLDATGDVNKDSYIDCEDNLIEEQSPLYICLNNDHDNGTQTEDRYYSSLYSYGENDLVMLAVDITDFPSGDDYAMKFEGLSDTIKLWETCEKLADCELPFDQALPLWRINDSVYIEGINTGSGFLDVILLKNQVEVARDRVKIQVIGDEPVITDLQFLEPSGTVGGKAKVKLKVVTRGASVQSYTLQEIEDTTLHSCSPIQFGPAVVGAPVTDEICGATTTVYTWDWDTTATANGEYLVHNGSHTLTADFVFNVGGTQVTKTLEYNVDVLNLTIAEVDPPGHCAWTGDNAPVPIRVCIDDNDLSDPVNLTLQIFRCADDTEGWTPVRTMTGTTTTGVHTFQWDGTDGSAPVEPGLYTYEVIAEQDDVNKYNDTVHDETKYRSEYLDVLRARDSQGDPIYQVEYDGYDDNGTLDDYDDNYNYIIRWYALQDTADPLKNASAGSLTLYGPDPARGIWTDSAKLMTWGDITQFPCVVHVGQYDGLVADNPSLKHGLRVPVSVNLMKSAGAYRFVLHTADDHADVYRDHRFVRPAKDLNGDAQNVGVGIFMSKKHAGDVGWTPKGIENVWNAIKGAYVQHEIHYYNDTPPRPFKPEWMQITDSRSTDKLNELSRQLLPNPPLDSVNPNAGGYKLLKNPVNGYHAKWLFNNMRWGDWHTYHPAGGVGCIVKYHSPVIWIYYGHAVPGEDTICPTTNSWISGKINGPRTNENYFYVWNDMESGALSKMRLAILGGCDTSGELPQYMIKQGAKIVITTRHYMNLEILSEFCQFLFCGYNGGNGLCYISNGQKYVYTDIGRVRSYATSAQNNAMDANPLAVGWSIGKNKNFALGFIDLWYGNSDICYRDRIRKDGSYSTYQYTWDHGYWHDDGVIKSPEED